MHNSANFDRAAPNNVENEVVLDHENTVPKRPKLRVPRNSTEVRMRLKLANSLIEFFDERYGS